VTPLQSSRVNTLQKHINAMDSFRKMLNSVGSLFAQNVNRQRRPCHRLGDQLADTLACDGSTESSGELGAR
jgi:hypothetical protein